MFAVIWWRTKLSTSREELLTIWGSWNDCERTQPHTLSLSLTLTPPTPPPPNQHSLLIWHVVFLFTQSSQQEPPEPHPWAAVSEERGSGSTVSTRSLTSDLWLLTSDFYREHTPPLVCDFHTSVGSVMMNTSADSEVNTVRVVNTRFWSKLLPKLSSQVQCNMKHFLTRLNAYV